MATMIDTKRLEDVAESDHRELEFFYAAMRSMKALILAVHEDYLDNGTPPSFDKVEALHLMSTDILEELERYLMPTCGVDVAVNPVEREH